jgi:hypothetical protein
MGPPEPVTGLPLTFACVAIYRNQSNIYLLNTVTKFNGNRILETIKVMAELH